MAARGIAWLDAPVTGAVHDVYKATILEGFGADNITGIVQRYLRR